VAGRDRAALGEDEVRAMPSVLDEVSPGLVLEDSPANASQKSVRPHHRVPRGVREELDAPGVCRRQLGGGRSRRQSVRNPEITLAAARRNAHAFSGTTPQRRRPDNRLQSPSRIRVPPQAMVIARRDKAERRTPGTEQKAQRQRELSGLKLQVIVGRLAGHEAKKSRRASRPAPKKARRSLRELKNFGRPEAGRRGRARGRRRGTPLRSWWRAGRARRNARLRRLLPRPRTTSETSHPHVDAIAASVDVGKLTRKGCAATARQGRYFAA